MYCEQEGQDSGKIYMGPDVSLFHPGPQQRAIFGTRQDYPGREFQGLKPPRKGFFNPLHP